MREFFKIPGFPTVIVLGADGVERDRVVGFDGDAAGFVSTLQDWAENKKTLFKYLETWAKDTTDVEWNYRIARRYESRYQNGLGQRYWRNVLKFDPDNQTGYWEEAVFNMAINSIREKSNPAPLQELMAATTNPDYRRSGYFALVRHFESSGDLEKTVTIYEKALQEFPQSTSFLNGFAWFIYEHKQSDRYLQGIKYAEQAVRLEPDADYLWDTLAWLYNAIDEHQKAVEAISKALQLSPDSDYFKQTLTKMKYDLENNSPK